MKIKFNVNYGKIKYGDIVDAKDIPNEELERLIAMGVIEEVADEQKDTNEQKEPEKKAADVPEVEKTTVAKRRARKARAKKVE